MYLRIIKNWLPLCRVSIFMMMARAGWVGGGMGFAAISHYVPNILPIMMCCILLLFYMLIKYFVISCNRQSICKTEKQAIFFPSLNAFRRILPQCLLFFFIFFSFVGDSCTSYTSLWQLHPHKRASITTILWLSSEDPIGLLMYKWLKQWKMTATFKAITLAQIQSPVQWIPKLLEDVKV